MVIGTIDNKNYQELVKNGLFLSGLVTIVKGVGTWSEVTRTIWTGLARWGRCSRSRKLPMRCWRRRAVWSGLWRRQRVEGVELITRRTRSIAQMTVNRWRIRCVKLTFSVSAHSIQPLLSYWPFKFGDARRFRGGLRRKHVLSGVWNDVDSTPGVMENVCS